MELKKKTYSISKGITSETVVICCDNSGAKKVKVIASIQNGGTKRRYRSSGVGDIIIGSVKVGVPKLKGTVVFGLIVRQKMPYLRKVTGTRVKFEDNAIILLKKIKRGEYEQLGTVIKGVVPREVSLKNPFFKNHGAKIV